MGLRLDWIGKARGRRTRAAAALAAIAAAFIIALPALAAAPVPASGTATIDGNPSEWVAADFFSMMKGSTTTTSWGTLNLRYDCRSHVLSAYVQAADGVTFLASRPENAYIRIDGVGKLVSGESGDDGVPPDFAWVGLGDTGATGYEASGVVAPGEHTVRAHVLMVDGSADGYMSLDSDPRTGPLTLDCGGVAPTSSATSSPSGQVEAATGRPITPPPTDASAPTPGTWAMSGLLMVIIGLVVIDLAALKAVRARNR